MATRPQLPVRLLATLGVVIKPYEIGHDAACVIERKADLQWPPRFGRREIPALRPCLTCQPSGRPAHRVTAPWLPRPRTRSRRTASKPRLLRWDYSANPDSCETTVAPYVPINKRSGIDAGGPPVRSTAAVILNVYPTAPNVR